MFKQKPESVFEIGCANGGFLKDLRDRFGDIKVGGMDISESINQCKEMFPGDFYLRSITDPWPIPDQSYDVVFSVGVLMYMFEPVHVLKEMFRVGKKVVFAEYHHPEVGPYGQMTRGYLDGDKVQLGIIRDYFSLLGVLKIPMQVEMENYQNKTIFICTPN